MTRSILKSSLWLVILAFFIVPINAFNYSGLGYDNTTLPSMYAQHKQSNGETGIRILRETVIGILSLFIGIMIHELGHIWTIFGITKKPVTTEVVTEGYFRYSIKTGDIEELKKLSHDQLRNIYLSGVIIGFLFIVFIAALLQSWGALIALGLYVFGCDTDIKQVILVNKDKEVRES